RMRGVEGFQKIVAIKRILPHLTENDEFVTMFIDEAKLAAQLQHPNIIHI
ncbi:MAG: serine/threonine protein kinase, partial [Acidobacteria bacterium]|nr:serine/threonine protein kinase [Acidobacteriota bacterium]